MMERVYFVEDGLGYGERFVLGRLSGFSVNGTVHIMDGLQKFAQDIDINKGSLLSYLRSLESKGYVKINRRKLPNRVFVADIKLRLKEGKWIRVPRSFLYVDSPKMRGLLLTLASRVKKYNLASDLKIKRTAFYLKDLLTPDVRSPRTLAKLVRSLQDKGFILIERTRPFYVVRVIM
jgi:hypothetical protein